MPDLVIVTAVGAACYLIGCIRPWRRFRLWCWWVVMRPRNTALGRVELLLSLVVHADRLAVSYWQKWRGTEKPRVSRMPVMVVPRAERQAPHESPSDHDPRST